MARRKSSVQKLIGLETFTKYGIKTDQFEYAFFQVEPVNISVLSQGSSMPSFRSSRSTFRCCRRSMSPQRCSISCSC